MKHCSSNLHSQLELGMLPESLPYCRGNQRTTVKGFIIGIKLNTHSPVQREYQGTNVRPVDEVQMHGYTCLSKSLIHSSLLSSSPSDEATVTITATIRSWRQCRQFAADDFDSNQTNVSPYTEEMIANQTQS